VFVTGYSPDELPEDDAITTVLQKPIGPNAVLRAVARLLGRETLVGAGE
jgi:hypothetical protein